MLNHALYKFLAAAIVVVTIAIVPISTASAQDDVITPGTAVTGTLDNDNYFDVWRYASPGSETIAVSVEATSGDLDTALAVITSKLSAVGVSDDMNAGSGNYNSTIASLSIPEADTVFIFVTRAGGETGASFGDYSLLLTNTAEAGGLGGLDTGGDTGNTSSSFTLDQATVESGPEDAWNHLRALEVVPPEWEGELGITIPSGAFVESSRNDDLGVLFMRVGRGYQAADVIIHADVVWNSNDPAMGCGVFFRAQSSGETYSVLLGREGWIEVGGYFPSYERLGIWDISGLNTRDGGDNNLLVTAVDDQIRIFVNYELAGAAEDSRISGAGEFYIFSYKTESETARCDFNNYWAISIFE